MAKAMQKSLETEKAADEQTAENSEATENDANELETQQWSVVSFEGVAMSGLSYEEARQWVEKLNAQKISGLCIITDEAAARISK
jgi:hypothetical protein